MQQREYQMKGSAFLARPRKHGVILADDPGLGKTNQVLCAIAVMNPEPESVLIIAPLSAHGTWLEETRLWLGEEAQIITANKGYADTRIVIASFDEAANLNRLPIDWDLIVIDEIHLLRNRNTRAYRGIKPLTKRAKLVIGTTGSPIVNGAHDLWAQLSLVAPKDFRSYWRFCEQHCVTYTNMFGYPETTGAVRYPEDFKKFTTRYMIRRRKEKVLTELPLKIRQPLYVTMHKEQAALYEQLVNEMMAHIGNDEFILTDSVIAQITRLRQTLIAPTLYGADVRSAAIDAVVEAIGLDFDSKKSVMVFTPYAAVIPTLRTVIKSRLNQYDPDIFVMTGDMTGQQRNDIVRRFQQENHKHKVFICTIGVATSFTSTAATVGYFLGYDWTPANNIQAEDRMHRIGQTVPVHIKYVIHRNTVDEHIMKILDSKTTWAELSSNPLSFMKGTTPQQKDAAA